MMAEPAGDTRRRHPPATPLMAAKRADSVDSEVFVRTVINTDDITTLLVKSTGLTQVVKPNTALLGELPRLRHW